MEIEEALTRLVGGRGIDQLTDDDVQAILAHFDAATLKAVIAFITHYFLGDWQPEQYDVEAGCNMRPRVLRAYEDRGRISNDPAIFEWVITSECYKKRQLLPATWDKLSENLVSTGYEKLLETIDKVFTRELRISKTLGALLWDRIKWALKGVLNSYEKVVSGDTSSVEKAQRLAKKMQGQPEKEIISAIQRQLGVTDQTAKEYLSTDVSSLRKGQTRSNFDGATGSGVSHCGRFDDWEDEHDAPKSHECRPDESYDLVFGDDPDICDEVRKERISAQYMKLWLFACDDDWQRSILRSVRSQLDVNDINAADFEHNRQCLKKAIREAAEAHGITQKEVRRVLEEIYEGRDAGLDCDDEWPADLGMAGC
jgi:predicted transcriptional regulator